MSQKMIAQYRKAKAEAEQRMKDRMPPDWITEKMKKEAKKTSELNKGRLNESDYWLGMMSMWFLLRREKMLNNVPKD